MIDLHVHTTCSDGTLTPAQVVALASDRGLRALAVTDHDTVNGVAAASEEGARTGVEVIAGLEISVQWDRGILHILGYFVNPDHPRLLDVLDFLRRGRDARTPKMVEKLRKLDVPISVEEVEIEAKGGIVGRPHLANVLLRKGLVRHRQEAFDRYLKKGAPAYVEKIKLPPFQAIEAILDAGGIPVMAHPYSLEVGTSNGLEAVLEDLIPLGLRGIEVYYPRHTKEQTQAFLDIAKKKDLLITGGTDFHGANKPDVELGVFPHPYGTLPYSLLQDLKDSIALPFASSSVDSTRITSLHKPTPDSEALAKSGTRRS